MNSKTDFQSSLSNKNKKAVWFWQSNLCNDIERKGWERYSDFQSDFIEECYQRNEFEIELNNFIINFNRNVQFKKDNQNNENAIKREEIDLNNYLREERFSFPENPSKLFNNVNCKYSGSEFINQWGRKNCNIIKRVLDTDYDSIIALAIEGIVNVLFSYKTYMFIFLFLGILIEGRLLDKEFDAQQMVKQLQICHNRLDSLECVARLYSSNSFLYKLVNLTLRDDDRTKIDTLGPFCYLLQLHSHSTEHLNQKIVYRGMTLTNEMIEEYKKAVGTKIQWLSFTSTSKNRTVAEIYGLNALFIIQFIPNNPMGSDLSSISPFPAEEELLFPAGQIFLIEKIEFDFKTSKHLIYMRNS